MADYSKNKPYQIYILKHPNTLEIFYVGKTKQSLKNRLGGHLNDGLIGKKNQKSDYIKNVLSLKKNPIIESIEIVADVHRPNEREAYWINHFKTQGCSLTNNAGGKRIGAGRKKTGRTTKVISFSIPPEMEDEIRATVKEKVSSFAGIVPTIKEHEQKTGKPHNLYKPATSVPNELKNEPTIELTGMALDLWIKRQKFLKK